MPIRIDQLCETMVLYCSLRGLAVWTNGIVQSDITVSVKDSVFSHNTAPRDTGYVGDPWSEWDSILRIRCLDVAARNGRANHIYVQLNRLHFEQCFGMNGWGFLFRGTCILTVDAEVHK